jgi:hypothetical protein
MRAAGIISLFKNILLSKICDNRFLYVRFYKSQLLYSPVFAQQISLDQSRILHLGRHHRDHY